MVNWYGFAKNPMDSLTSWDEVLSKGSKWKFNVIRLVVRKSTLTYTQLDAVLAKIEAAGCKAVLDNHLLSQWVFVDPKFGSQAMRDFWVKLVTDYKDNKTIIAWEIANEPFSNVWDNVNVTTSADVPKEYAIITDLIRAIDPIRPIVVMVPHTIDPGVSLRPNWIATFHPYTYGDLMLQSDAQTILDYRKTQITRTMAFGYSSGWIGEIECHPSGTTPLPVEKWYVSEVIKYGYLNGLGFNYWKYFNPVDDAGANPDEVIASSGFTAATISRPYVSGVRLYDPQGNLLNINGWNMRDRFVEEDIKWLHDNGYNSVRLVVYWSSIEKTEGTVDFTLAKQFLDAAKKYNMWVWVDFHQWEYSNFFTFASGGGFPSWLVAAGGYTNDAAGQQAFSDDFYLKRGYGATSWAKYVAFMQKLMNLIKPYSNILCVEPMNEPMVGAAHINEARTACNARYTEIIDIIRTIIPDMMICLHHIDNGFNIKQARPNLFWTKSAYSEYGAGLTEASITTYLTNRYNEFVVKMGVPWIISETGVTPSTAQAVADSFITTLFTKYRAMFGDGCVGWNFWLYDKAASSGGYKCPRNADGSPSWLQPIIAKNQSVLKPIMTYTLTTLSINGSIVRYPNASLYASGSTVSLTAVPLSGYTFAGWSGDASGITNPITIQMISNKSVTASFTLTPIDPCAAVKAQLALANAQIASLQTQLNTANSQITSLQASNLALTVQVTNLQSKITAAQQALA